MSLPAGATGTALVTSEISKSQRVRLKEIGGSISNLRSGLLC